MTHDHWKIADLPWGRFNRGAVNDDLIKVIKAAALVEYNGYDYADYLRNVFFDNAQLQKEVREWAGEEVQHGEALGKWAALADPSWDFQAAVKRFREGYKLNLQVNESIRGSRTGELIARCVVETATSSYYSAIGDAVDEPVLQQICRNIAADELRHYKLFYDHMKQYLAAEGLNRIDRLKIGLSRVRESEDDELSYAFYAANTDGTEPYDRVRYNNEYLSRAYGYYRRRHVERGVAMIFKAIGLKPHTPLQGAANTVTWWLIGKKAKAARQHFANAA